MPIPARLFQLFSRREFTSQRNRCILDWPGSSRRWNVGSTGGCSFHPSTGYLNERANLNPISEVWSCGGGTQSGAIAALIGQGKLPRPDVAFMTDTGRERSGTWPFVDGFIRPNLARAGVELTIVNASEFARLDVYWNDTVLLPGFTTLSGQVGKLSPFCSGKWKRDVGERFLRSIGVERCRNWIGISRDEAGRIRAQHRGWLELWYPLIFEIPMRRDECVELIRSMGWLGEIPHSACWMCPNATDAEWLDMKRNWPDDFTRACQLEAETRVRDPHFYLHQSCVLLIDVDFDAQRTMFADRGCTTGCFT